MSKKDKGKGGKKVAEIPDHLKYVLLVLEFLYFLWQPALKPIEPLLQGLPYIQLYLISLLVPKDANTYVVTKAYYTMHNDS